VADRADGLVGQTLIAINCQLGWPKVAVIASMGRLQWICDLTLKG
jgi:hypothetical protein